MIFIQNWEGNEGGRLQWDWDDKMKISSFFDGGMTIERKDALTFKKE